MVIIPISTLPVDNYMSAPHNIRPLTSHSCRPLKTCAVHRIKVPYTNYLSWKITELFFFFQIHKNFFFVHDQDNECQEVAVYSQIFTQI